MGGATTRIPMTHRVLSPNYNYDATDNPHDQPAVQLSASIFGFLDEEATVLSSPENNVYFDIQHANEDDDQTENPEDIEDKIKFWETQRENLHATLFRTTSFESKIRSISKEVLGEVEITGNICSCVRPDSGGCQSCRMREICSRLQNFGYDSAICKSKWKSSLDIPAGEHTFVDVIDTSNRKKGEVRVVIELELRGQFEMKKGSEEYNSLVCKLPDIFVGKIDRLQTLIKILSDAAKKCMNEKKMHMGPWRKQAKWLRVAERTTAGTLVKPLTVDSYVTRPTKTIASMLTMDLLDKVPNMSYCYVHTVKVL